MGLGSKTLQFAYFERIPTALILHLRSIMRLEHATAILILLGQQAGYLQQREPTRSEQMLKRGLVLYRDSSSETYGSDNDQSSYSSDTDSSA